MKNKIVNFIPKDKDAEILLPCPKPSKHYMPEWFKKMPHSLSDLDNKKMDETAKKCPPFIDALTSGYTQELVCDLRIINNGKDLDTGEDLIQYSWSGPIKPISSRKEDTRSRRVLPDFDGYYNAEFHWNTFWEPQTPPGYSALYIHPANRFDLPFITLNGIIDTDKWSITGPLPFLIKRGFEGVIPAGTPIYQILFIKRDNWESSASEYNERYSKKLEYTVRRFFNDGYKKMYWSRKNYK
jgi:hypothetical protein